MREELVVQMEKVFWEGEEEGAWMGQHARLSSQGWPERVAAVC